jgi:hypothetical protein
MNHEGRILKIVGRRNHGAPFVNFAMEKRSIIWQADLVPRVSMSEAAPDGRLAVHEFIDISHISDITWGII